MPQINTQDRTPANTEVHVFCMLYSHVPTLLLLPPNLVTITFALASAVALKTYVLEKNTIAQIFA